MNDPINFDIDGLAARYELHPERCDVFVEGEFDQGLVRGFLENQGRTDVAVFPVSVVNISSDSVLRRNLPHPSRRSEVITLAIELEARGVSAKQVACIGDADFEYLLPQRIVCALLLFTDYASMELYAFSDDTIHRVLVLVSPNTSSTGAGLIGDVSGPLQFLFSLRAANFDLHLGLPWIDRIERFITVEGERLDFDADEYMKRYVVDRLPREEVERFKARFGEIQSLLSSDIRCRIHGHDFVRLVTWYFRRVERCNYLNEDSVHHMLNLAIRPEDLLPQPMFSTLLKRLAS